jgi:hypothetical protein
MARHHKQILGRSLSGTVEQSNHAQIIWRTDNNWPQSTELIDAHQMAMVSRSKQSNRLVPLELNPYLNRLRSTTTSNTNIPCRNIFFHKRHNEPQTYPERHNDKEWAWWATMKTHIEPTIHSKSAYNFLNNSGIPQPILQNIWTLPLPSKIRFFFYGCLYLTNYKLLWIYSKKDDRQLKNALCVTLTVQKHPTTSSPPVRRHKHSQMKLPVQPCGGEIAQSRRNGPRFAKWTNMVHERQHHGHYGTSATDGSFKAE